MGNLRNLRQQRPLTQEQKVLAAINSEHPTVQKAIEKIIFVAEMAHTEKELQELVDPWVRRVETVFEHEGEYKRFLFRWCGDHFEITGEDGQILQAGDGTASGDENPPKEPTLVYVLDKD